MRRVPDKKKIGLFMMIGLTVFAVIIGSFLSNKFLGKDETILVMYFNESIQGLNVGSSVVFKGVEIGKVAKINIVSDDGGLRFRIPVYVKLLSNQGFNTKGAYANKRALLDDLISKGLRARLATQSILTGQLLIEFELLPDTPVVLQNSPNDKNYIEVPTTLSAKEALSKGFQSLPFRQSMEKLNILLDELNKQMPVLLPQVTKTFKDVDKVVTSNTRATSDAFDNFNKAMVSVNEAAKSIRNLTDYLERHPEALLKGKRGN